MIQNNQWLKKIPIDIGYYFAGFADGEGSFNVSLRKGDGYRYGWQICLCFCVSQRDLVILNLLKRYLGAGRIKSRPDGVHLLVVENLNSLTDRVIPFFERFGFLSSRMKTNFSIFKKIVEIVKQERHLTQEGLRGVVELREKLNEGRGRKRKYNLNDVYPT